MLLVAIQMFSDPYLLYSADFRAPQLYYFSGPQLENSHLL